MRALLAISRVFFSLIKPDKSGTLSKLLFTICKPTKWGKFSMPITDFKLQPFKFTLYMVLLMSLNIVSFLVKIFPFPLIIWSWGKHVAVKLGKVCIFVLVMSSTLTVDGKWRYPGSIMAFPQSSICLKLMNLCHYTCINTAGFCMPYFKSIFLNEVVAPIKSTGSCYIWQYPHSNCFRK